MATIDIIDATVRVETFRASDGGCLGYLVVDAASGAAMAIDPRLDEVDRFIEALRARGASLIYALDTHTHADHLSGVRRLAKKTDATILAHIASKLRIAARRVRGGEAFKLGNALVTVPRCARPYARLPRAPRRCPPVHGRCPVRRRRRAHRLRGRKRLGPVRHVPALRGLARRDRGPSWPRLRGPAGDHHRGGEGAERAPP